MPPNHVFRRRPSRLAIGSFAVGLALTLGGVIGAALAASQNSDLQPASSPTAFVPANAAPTVPGLKALSPSDVPEGGLSIGNLRVLPVGKTPNYSYHAQPGPGETLVRVDPGDKLPSSAHLLAVPESTSWTVSRGAAEIAQASDETTRVLMEGAVIHPTRGRPDWELTAGVLAAGTQFEDSLMSREAANFTFTASGATAFVYDASPGPSVDRFWHVRLVVAGRWVALDAPVVEFSEVAQFLNALVEANK